MWAPLVYDLEIVRAISDPNTPLIKGIEYVKNWGDHANMGIAVLAAFDYETDSYLVFLEDNLSEFQELADSRWPLVTFNGKRFDNKVLEANGITVPFGSAYDLADEVARVTGGRHKGYSLDNIAAANFGIHKTENGAMAPVYWQLKQYGRVISYCLSDVKITRMLFDRVLSTGELINPVTNLPMLLRQPQLEATEWEL